MVTCHRCKKEIGLVWPDSQATNLNLALHVTLNGCYGEYADTLDGDERYILCHQCGHQLVTFLGDTTIFHYPTDECPREWANTAKAELILQQEEQDYRDSAMLSHRGYTPPEHITIHPKVQFVFHETYWDSYWTIASQPSTRFVTYREAVTALPAPDEYTESQK